MFNVRNSLLNICYKHFVSKHIMVKPITSTCARPITFKTFRDYNPDEKIDFEVSKNPKEWDYVTRLLPLKIIPEPSVKDSYPSGWKPQSFDVLNGPYYVRRSRNHMIPVYLSTRLRGMKKVTYVKHIMGDIWRFSSELVSHLQDVTKKPIGYKVDEVGCKLLLRGDYVYYTEQFLLKKGF